MIVIEADRIITMSASQARRQWFQLLGMVDETGLVAVLTHRGRPKFAVVPYKLAQGAGVAIRRRGRTRPIAALVRLGQGTSG